MSDPQDNDEQIIEIQSYCLSQRDKPPQIITCILTTDCIDYSDHWVPPRIVPPLALTIVEIDEESSSMKQTVGNEWTEAQWEKTGAKPKHRRKRQPLKLHLPNLRCRRMRPHLLRYPRLPCLRSMVHYDLIEDSYLAPVIPVADKCFPDLTVYQHRLPQLKLLDKIPELQEPEEYS